MTPRPIPGVHCVVCKQPMQQEAATHYPEHVPINQRFVCSPRCSDALEKKTESRTRERQALRGLGLGDSMAALGLEEPSEAKKARAALDSIQQQEPPHAEELEHLKTVSDPHKIINLVQTLLGQAVLLEAADQVMLLELALSYLAEVTDRVRAEHA